MHIPVLFILIYIVRGTTTQEALTTYVSHGFCVSGGARQPALATLGQCLQTCHDTKSCLALDYNELENACYFHGISTVCTEKTETEGCLHFGLVSCDFPDDILGNEVTTSQRPLSNATPTTTSLTPSTTTPTTTPTRSTTGGVVTTATRRTTTTTSTTTTIPTTTMETTNPEKDTTTGPGSQTTSGPPSNVQGSNLDKTGYVFEVTGMHIRRGYLLRAGIREQECLDVCANHPLCLAVDYTSREGGCYAHGTATYCGELEPLESSTHYKRVPCVASASRDGAQEIYNGMYSPGGSELCPSDCTIESCLAACYLEEQCLGLTINTTSGACHSHSYSSVCNIARIAAEVVQVNIGQCFADKCLSMPCFNGGSCMEELGGYSCICPTGFQGVRCQINIDDCSGSPCENEGTCIDLIDGYTCHCAPGFTGLHCNIDIDECSSDPCVNGACIDTVNNFICSCSAGFSGTLCQTDINDCSPSMCQNGGTCHDGINSFTCSCPLGYGGQTCSQKMSVCWQDSKFVGRSQDLVITDKATPVAQCVGLCYTKETIQRFGAPVVERGCAPFSEFPSMQLGCTMEDRLRTVTCYCDSRRCNGLSVDAMTSQILHLPLDKNTRDHSGLNNHALPLSRTDTVNYDCDDASTGCSVNMDGNQCLVVSSLSGYVFGHPDPLELSLFLPRMTAVVAFKKSTANIPNQGIFGTQDFLSNGAPRFQFAQGYPSRDYISAGLHGDTDQTADINDYVAHVDEDRWYLATLTYDGLYQEPSGPGDIPYFQSTVLYLDDERAQGNSRVNIGNVSMNLQPVTVGCSGGNYFNGQIDEVRLFNDVISQYDREALIAMRD